MNFQLLKLEHPDMINCIRRKQEKIIYDTVDGILLYDRENELYFADAYSDQAAQQIISLLQQQNDVAIRGRYLAQKLKEQSYQVSKPYHYVVCMEMIPYELPTCAYAIRKADLSMLPFICANYSNPGLANPEYIQARIQVGMLAAFDNERAVAFIGTHSSGSIGILEVIEAYRRKGIGEALTKAMMNERIKNGLLPFAEIYLDNKKSLSLADKLHLHCSKSLIYWARSA